MKLPDIAEQWKCIVALFVGAGALCSLAVGATTYFATAAQLKEVEIRQDQQQQQMLQMNINQSYHNYLLRLDSLRAAYVDKPMPLEVKQQVEWLEKQLKILEKQMGISK